MKGKYIKTTVFYVKPHINLLLVDLDLIYFIFTNQIQSIILVYANYIMCCINYFVVMSICQLPN